MAEDLRELRPDRAELMAELTRLAFEVKQLADPLDEAQFNWRPRPDAWSVGQCIDHLVRVNRAYLDALETAAEEGRKAGEMGDEPLVPGRVGTWFLRQLEPPPKRRFPTVRKGVPAERCIKAATLVAFGGEQQRLIALVRWTADLDCNCIRFRNPLAFGLRTFSLATGLLVLAAHERRHLWQARRVVEHPDFPA